MEKLGEYLHFYRKTMAKAPPELMIEISVAPADPPLLITTVCYSGSEQESKSVLKPIREFGPPLFDGVHQTKLHQITNPSEEAIAQAEVSRRPGQHIPLEQEYPSVIENCPSICPYLILASSAFLTSRCSFSLKLNLNSNRPPIM